MIKPLDVVGSFEAEVSIGRRSKIAELFVVKGSQKDILGDSTVKNLGELKVGLEVNNVEMEYKSFSKINGVQATIEMDPDIKPVFQPVRRIPIPMEAAVN